MSTVDLEAKIPNNVGLRENKRLAEDLGQIEATLFRRLVDFVSATAGAEKAREIGELPSNERRQPSIRFGG
jgi:hypothetical protein